MKTSVKYFRLTVGP